MATDQQFLDGLADQKVLPIFRGSHQEIYASLDLMRPLNLKFIELTTSIPNWQKILLDLSSEYAVGVGTLKTQSEIDDAIANGARFLVSFGSFPALLTAHSVLPVIPGAFTPSEFLQLFQSGIGIVKLFPASNFGSKYLSDLKVLLPELQFIVTGGIKNSSSDINEWLKAGAIAVGIGSSLGNPIANPDEFKKAVEELANALHSNKQG